MKTLTTGGAEPNESSPTPETPSYKTLEIIRHIETHVKTDDQAIVITRDNTVKEAVFEGSYEKCQEFIKAQKSNATNQTREDAHNN